MSGKIKRALLMSALSTVLFCIVYAVVIMPPGAGASAVALIGAIFFVAILTVNLAILRK